jgi:hypothetical protein
MRQPIRKVKLFFPKLRDQGLPPTQKNTIPIDEQINDFLIVGWSKDMRKIIDVKYSYQYVQSNNYEGEFERALLIYEEVEA